MSRGHCGRTSRRTGSQGGSTSRGAHHPVNGGRGRIPPGGGHQHLHEAARRLHGGPRPPACQRRPASRRYRRLPQHVRAISASRFDRPLTDPGHALWQLMLLRSKHHVWFKTMILGTRPQGAVSDHCVSCLFWGRGVIAHLVLFQTG